MGFLYDGELITGDGVMEEEERKRGFKKVVRALVPRVNGPMLRRMHGKMDMSGLGRKMVPDFGKLRVKPTIRRPNFRMRGW